MTDVYDLEALRFTYRDTTALDGLTLGIRAGERVALLGPNGSGKSTLLRLMCALSFATGGTARAFGAPLTEAQFADPARNHAFRRRVGLVFQSPDVQLFNPTVFDEIAFGPLQMGWTAEETRARVEEALAAHDLGPLRDRPPHRLSGGEKKRVALASVLVTGPEVLLLDEPTAALDPANRDALVHRLGSPELAGKTIVTATHELDIVPAIADRAVVMVAGKVIADGRPADLLADHDLLRRAGLTHVHRHTHDGREHAHHHVHALDPGAHGHGARGHGGHGHGANVGHGEHQPDRFNHDGHGK
ncbi:energy-coupling factor ABC transporter ATP-binding protein [Acidimangrovimonas sediminis]|uniref:energy-coupling factor ABC transporter ATP-binding protein n=1 Tax=Acidimangrovimonas sediminis TaxID=2056283 RepID=UPI000C80263E|nr:ABC transporter ATP-binding protein [Acidimangrovimonas sediminis]